MKIFEVDGVRVGVSDREDGNMRIFDDADYERATENRREFLSKMGLAMESTYSVRIDYDTDDFCRFMRAGDQNGLWLGRKAARCDGLLITERGAGLFLPLADCLGLVLYDAENEAMMVVHCGRHTLMQDGAFRAVWYMGEEAGARPKNIIAWLSPSAGKDNYPIYAMNGVSLQEAAVEQLVRAGVSDDNIRKSDIDTTTDERYFSYSQGDKKGRFAIVGAID